MSEILLIHITGRDRKGLTRKFTEILAQYSVNILDIGQSVIHEYLSLGILVEIPCQEEFSNIFKDILYEGHNLGLSVNLQPVEPDHYESWVAGHGQERRRITLLGKRLTAQHIAAVSAIVHDNGLNIDTISRLTGRISLQHPQKGQWASIQYSASGTPRDVEGMRRGLMELAQKTGIDISLYADTIYSRNRRLVVFDMDSTLIQIEVIDELARLAGAGDKVSAITAAAMRGELDFKESFRRRVACLKGLRESDLQKITQNLPLTDGVELLTATLKGLGYKLGILSGGFTFAGDYLREQFGFDYVHANSLEIVDGVVTGNVQGEIIDGRRKAELLAEIARNEGIHIEQTIAVGDGANDLPMLGLAGLGVAFHAKPVVCEQASNSLSNGGLDGLLYLMGIEDREIISRRD